MKAVDYLKWDEKKISDFSTRNISDMYNAGYLFTRIDKGVMQQTRSVRIDLGVFEPSSENRRILKKVSDMAVNELPLPVPDYDWHIGKLAKDFYDTKFGSGIMSAQKVKEIMTDTDRSNFNCLLVYETSGNIIGYAICYQNDDMVHYSYPFYNLSAPKDTGLGMMLLAIQKAKSLGKKYLYLGSLQRPGDKYKLQFSGLEWFDSHSWSKDIERAKNVLLMPKG
ncbi:MAG: hypothetical protein M1459_01270 [Patescibacteria group bacterium]|nr:hypothetical protein [Patescibacteria group bacterium]